MTYLIKYFFIFIYCIYIYFKLINYKIIIRKNSISFCVLSLVLSLLSYFLHIKILELANIIPLFILWLFLSKFQIAPQLSFVSIIISFTLSYTLFSISSAIILIILISQYHYLLPRPSLTIIIAIIEWILIIKLFHFKRFKKGMPFLFSSQFINIATILCLFLITFLTYLRHKNTTNFWSQSCSLAIFVASLAILIYWWQTQLTKTYKHRLLLRELESLRTETQEKDKLIAVLKEQNQELGRLIHRDNKRIPAMEYAVYDYIYADIENKEDRIAYGNTLIYEIQQLSNSRNLTLTEINNKRTLLYATGITALDALLNYMAKRALTEQIQFSVHSSIDLKEHIPKSILSEDFSHLLSDLLENALIAVRYAKTRYIQLQFYVSEKSFILELADSGIPFEPASLTGFGLYQRSTHTDTGGSGIGLIDIWKIKEKYRASIHIEEYEIHAPYAKKVTVIFNRKNQYTIRTFRKEHIAKGMERSDLQIYSHVS